MRLRFSPRARSAIEEIFEHLSERSPSGARNVLRHIYIALQFIAGHPEASPRTDNPDVRVKIVERYRYKVFYRTSNDGIDILHVRHGSRQPWQPS